MAGTPPPATVGPAGEVQTPTLAEQIVASGDTSSGETRDAGDEHEAIEKAGEKITEGAGEALSEAEGIEDLRLHGKAGVAVAARIAMMPHVLQLLRERKWREACAYVRDTIGYSDYRAVIKLAAEHLGLELDVARELGGAAQVAKYARYASYSLPAVDAAIEMLHFQYEGLTEIARAHEEGRRDNRIYLYADAWARTFLYGHYSNPALVSREQLEAVQSGVRDGRATLAACGAEAANIGRQLLATYHSENNVLRALQDALIQRAGISGIKLHEGR
jgi:hypothetical protein